MRCAPEPYGCNCLWTPVFDNVDDFVEHYNESTEKVRFDNLSREIFFWMEKNRLLTKIQDTIRYELTTNIKRFRHEVLLDDE